MAKRKKSTGWKIFLTLFLIIILMIAGTTVYIKSQYQDIVKDVIKKEIDKRVKPDVYTGIDFTVFRTFPYATVVFKNTTVKDPLQPDSLLLEARRIYFKIDVIQLLKENYDLKKIEIEEANLNIFTDKKGNVNYDIFKEDQDSVDTELSIELKKIALEDVQVTYQNNKSQNRFGFKFLKSTVKGEFDKKNYEMAISGDFKLNVSRIGNKPWNLKNKMNADLVLNVASEQEKFSVSNGELKFNAIPLHLDGSLYYGDSKQIDLEMESPAIDIKKLLDDLPEKYTQKLNDYAIEVSPFVKVCLKGPYGSGNNPHITSNFGIENGIITHKKSGIKVKDLAFKGSFNNGEKNNSATSRLRVEQIKGFLDDQEFSGSLTVKNLKNPNIGITTKSRIDVEKIKQFMKLDTLQQVKGQIALNMDFSFSPADINNIKPQDFIQGSADGTASLDNVSIGFKESETIYTDLSGKFEFTSTDVLIKDLKGFINKKNDFHIRGYMENLLPFLFFSDQRMHIIADLKSQYLSLDDLLTESKENEQKAEYKVSLPEDISFNFDANIKELDFRRFHGKKIDGNIKMTGNKVILENLNFNGMGGSVKARGNVKLTDKNDVDVQGKAYFDNVEIRKVFYQLENFNQEGLTHKSISGRLTSDFTFRAKFNENLKPIGKTFNATADVLINDGKLVNYKPLEDLSRFIKVEDLSNIEFGTLKNTITVKDEKFIIPRMKIKSNVADIKLAGSHTFHNKIDYHLELLLSDLLSREACENKKENSKFGRIKDDGLHRTKLFLKVGGTTENPEFTYDTQGLKKKFKKDMKKEKTELKQLLHDEFGAYENDSTIEQKPKTEKEKKKEKRKKEKEKRQKRLEKREEGEFIIEWEEE